MIKYLLPACLLLLLPACRCTTAHSYFITPISHHYFADFGNDSYWVYQNESNAADIDTLRLCGKTQEMFYNTVENDCDGDYFETVKYSLVKSNLDTLYVTVQSNANIDLIYFMGTYDSTSISFNTNLKKDNNLFDISYSRQDSLEYHPSYAVNGNAYSDVYGFKLSQTKYGNPEYFFFSKDVGLISFSIYDMQRNMRGNYTLTAYKIV